MIVPLDARQVARIESVHRGYLYQHLYATGCMLLAGSNGVRSITIEADEDIELEMGDRHYVQVKTRSSPLVHSDIAGALKRFDRLRVEHQSGRRCGQPTFVVIANTTVGKELRGRLDAGEIPKDVLLATPGGPENTPSWLPPVWSDLAEGIAWCAQQASTLPMATLEPETLVWKVAGRVLLAATGQGQGHTFEVSELPRLFEQLAIQLQQFPTPPVAYRPLEGEPALDDGARVRIVTGLSGAGKTGWATHEALYLGDECAYYDVGDVPGPAIAASLVRELAAQWAAPNPGGLRQVLLPGTTGLEGIRALDNFLETSGARALVVLDNAHRVAASDLRMLIDATRHMRIVMLAQPSSSITELESVAGLRQEALGGWGLDQAAAEVQARGARATVAELGRLLKLTGGLPLYVRSAAELAANQYGGSIGAMCTSVEGNANLSATAQETILDRVFDALSESAKNTVVALSLSDVPLSLEEASRVTKAIFATHAGGLAASVRRLQSLGIVRVHGAMRIQVHDAFRVIGRRELSDVSKDEANAGRQALKEVLVASFKNTYDLTRFPLLVRTLVELEELKALVDIATEEWFHELGVDSGIWDALARAASNESTDPEQRFYALDGLVFSEMKFGDPVKVRTRLEAMERLVSRHLLGPHEELVLLLKQMLFHSSRGDETATVQAMDRARGLAQMVPEHQRILRYNFAYALFRLGKNPQAEAIAGELVNEYFELLGLDPLGITGLSNLRIAEKLVSTPTLQDDLKHLADSLDLLAQTTNAQGRDSVLARVHAAKFYGLANAVDSFIRINQDLVDEFVGRSDYVGARQVIEDHLLPTVIEHKMLGRVLAVRSQYAVVLGYCGEFQAANDELNRLEPYRDGLTAEQLGELENQRALITWLQERQSRILQQTTTKGQGVKIGRNSLCPCKSGLKYKRCHGRL